jgi:LPS sulfotransferase NodH
MQRTGSSLICRALRDTKLAGLPLEYMHPRLISAFAERLGNKTLHMRELLVFLERHRSTANGMFGIKVHLNHLKRAAGSDEAVNRFLGHFEAAILVHRRDKLMQAVSYERAIQTQVWEAEKPDEVARARQSSVSYNGEAIAKHLAIFIENEREWRSRLEHSRARVYAVAYEDLVADFPAQMHAIAEFLGDPALAGVAFDNPPHHQLRDEVSDEWAARFLVEIRGATPTAHST